MYLKDLGEGWLNLPVSARRVEATGIASDSRSVRPGYLFVAVKGESVDGHRFIPEAVRAGAVAVVGEKRVHSRRWKVPYISVRDSRKALGQLSAAFYRHPSRDICLVGVTGTKGKTTTAWILAAIFEAAGRRAGLFGTVSNRIGEEILPAKNTTPGPLEMEKYLRCLADRGGTHAVMEVSSHGIVQNRLVGIEFSAGIFTNLAPEHLDYHGTMENYLNAKASFFSDLGPERIAILPRAEPTSRWIARQTVARIVWYGREAGDGLEDVKRDGEGTQLVWKGVTMHTRLWGEHNLLNILAAVSAAEALGFDLDVIARGIARAVPPPGRLEEIPNQSGLRVFVDYAHTEGSLGTVLQSLRAITPGRIITVFGCGGDRDRQKRPHMGRTAELLSDRVLITSDNPRHEDPDRIIGEITAGLARRFEAAVVPDRHEAIGLAVTMAKPGDTVLIAGKGHETYQDIKGKRSFFDDRQEARAALADRAGEGK